MDRRALFAIVLAVTAACGGGATESVTRHPTATASASVGTATPQPTVVPTEAGLHHVALGAQRRESPADLARKYGGGTVTIEQRTAALADFGTKWKSLSSLPRAERVRQSVAWLTARPEIEAAGSSTTGLWARFKDGKMIMVPTYVWPAPPQQPHAHAHAVGEATGRADAKAVDVPDQPGLTSIDLFRYPEHALITGWLRDHGYAGTDVPPLVETLRRGAIGKAGVFFISTHGGSGNERNLGKADAGDTDRLYALATASAVRDKNDQLIRGASTSAMMHADATWESYEDELSQGQLVYMFIELNGQNQWNYGFTWRFVEKRFGIAPGALVYLNACESGGGAATDMRNIFLHMGATAVVAWMDSVRPATADLAAQFLFDRMLGENKTSGPGIVPDKPFERPWKLEKAVHSLHRHKLDFEVNPEGRPTALLVFGDDLMLVPSVKYMELDQLAKKLTLHGDFGPEPQGEHKVTIGGAKDCPVTSWGEDKIECTASEVCDGGVVVTKLGRKSNEAPLTSWLLHVLHKTQFQMTGQFGTGIGFEAHVCADVHEYREEPDDAPTHRDPIPFYVARDSKCAGGGAQGMLLTNGAKIWMTSGTTPIPVAFERPSGTSWCSMYGVIDPQSKQLKLSIFAVTTTGAGQIQGMKAGWGGGHAQGGAVIPVPGLFDGSVSPPPGMHAPAMPTAIFFPLDDKGAIAAGKKGPVSMANGHAQALVEWSATAPTNYPTDETPE